MKNVHATLAFLFVNIVEKLYLYIFYKYLVEMDLHEKQFLTYLSLFRWLEHFVLFLHTTTI